MSDDETPDTQAKPWDAHNARLRNGYRPKADAKHDLGVIDPREIVLDNMPPYEFGQLPEVYENYMMDNIAEFGGDPVAYACAFLSFSCSAFHSTVLYNQRPSKPTLLKSPNEHSITLAPSGYVKSGLMKDLKRPLDPFQDAMSGQGTKRKRGEKVKVAMVRKGSVEGVLRQVADNQGERLIVWNDEGMGLLRGAGAHHSESGVEMVSDMATSLYDAEEYAKALADESKSRFIPKCLGNLILAAVIDDFVGWKGLPIYTRLGAMARTTVGVISRPWERNAQMRVKGAEEAMTALMGKLRKLRYVHFVMDKEAEALWEGWLPKKESAIKALDRSGEAPTGFVEWCRKYDSRILSLASVFAAYAYVAGNVQAILGHAIAEATQEEKLTVGQEAQPVHLRTVMIDEATLKHAINFVEGFLLKTQLAFYEKAQGANEFGKELLNWVSFRLWKHTPETDNVLTRNDLFFKGPASVRPKGGVNEANKAKGARWIRALLDHGYIEVYRPENARVFRQPRSEEEEANYRIRPEFFMKFAADIEEFKAMYEGRQAELGRGNGGVMV